MLSLHERGQQHNTHTHIQTHNLVFLKYRILEEHRSHVYDTNFKNENTKTRSLGIRTQVGVH